MWSLPKLSFLFLAFICFQARAQYVLPDPQDQVSTIMEPPTFYLALSTGIDNYTGLIGIGGLIPFRDKFNLRLGAGLGAWGGKLSLGLKYQDMNRSGLGFGLGYSHCPGLEGIELEIQDQSGATKTITLDYLTVGSLNCTINKTWVFKRGNAFYIESGYAFATGGSEFYEVKDGSVLSQEEELILQILRPGGLIASLGFLIAF